MIRMCIATASSLLLITVPALGRPSSKSHVTWTLRAQTGPRQPFLGPVATQISHAVPPSSSEAGNGQGHYEWLDGMSGPRATSFAKHRVWVDGR